MGMSDWFCNGCGCGDDDDDDLVRVAGRPWFLLLLLIQILYVANDLVAATALSHAAVAYAGRKAKCGAHGSRAGIWTERVHQRIGRREGGSCGIEMHGWIGVGIAKRCWRTSKQAGHKHVKEWKRGTRDYM